MYEQGYVVRKKDDEGFTCVLTKKEYEEKREEYEINFKAVLIGETWFLENGGGIVDEEKEWQE